MLVGVTVAEAGPYAWLVFLLAAVATINDVLIQMIIAARVLYGMADRGQLPRAFAQISARTRTPAFATGVVALCIYR